MTSPVKITRLFALQLTLLVALAACAANPFQYAKTPLDKAHVALSTLEIAQTEVLALVKDAAIPAGAKTALKAASHDATLAATQAGNAIVEVEAARAALIAGTGTDERLRIANANLVQWTNTVLDRIKSIKAAVKEARHV